MADDKKFMDVAKPTDAKVDIGSKPMIVGHRPMAQDPMFAQSPTQPEPNANQNEAAAETTIMEPAKKKTISPLNDQNKATSDTQVETSKSTESDDVQKEATPVIADVQVAKPPDDLQSSGAQKTADKEDATKEKPVELDPEALAMEQDDEVQKLVDSKKYFVKVHQTNGSSKFPKILLIVLLILGLLGGLFYAIDTKKLDLGFELPFSVFDKKDAVSEETPHLDSVSEETQETASEQIVTKTFTSEELGLSFDYPGSTEASDIDWKPSITKKGEEFTVSGEAYEIDLFFVKFSGHIFSEDWVQSDESMTIYAYNKEFDDCKPSEDSTFVIEYSRSDDVCIVVSDYTEYIEEGDTVAPEESYGQTLTRASLYYQRKLQLNGKNYVIKVSSSPIGGEVSEAEAREAYDDFAAEIIKINESIRQLSS